jgi:nitroimidazol reductase NimA-like FMN-containing flavoprotein (pyridoxamine 5'-phosphate oxidase superfamily)
MNYRSVVLFGRAEAVESLEERRRVLDALTEKLLVGRSAQVRPPTEAELAKTHIVALPLSEASAKIRRGPPIDDDADLALPYWAGEIPLRLIRLPCVTAPDCTFDPPIF